MRAISWSVWLSTLAFVAMLAAGLIACLWWLKTSAQPQPATPPHIIIILADDLGWNDVSFHGSDQFQTPNIDALAYSGIILQDYYTQPICTPTRAALLTGRHPISNGMEHDVIYAPQPWGLPLSERILPEYLNPLGYVSRAVGKWHLGFFHSSYTPARRGFDSHYGVWLGHQDHYSHMGYEAHPGYDFHREINVTWDAAGKHSASLFTEEAEAIIREHDASRPLFLYLAHTTPHAPLQAPKDVVQRFSYIPDKKRQVFAAMVTMLDESVGRVMAALRCKNMLNNSIVLFLSDNGGATHGFNGNVASNWPLRGGKDTLWEGGVRGVGLIWSPLLKATPRVHRGLVNVQDWLPTLLEAGKDTLWEGGVRGVGLIWSPLLKATPRVHRGLVNVQDWLPTLLEAVGAPTDASKLDGVSQWPSFQQRAMSPYTIMLHNIDHRRNIAALRHGDWKLVTGRTYNGAYDGFYGRLCGEVPYDLDNIRESEAGRAVRGSPSPLPEDPEMLQLRAGATVSCTPATTTKFAASPHVIQVRQATFTVDDIETDSTLETTTTKKQRTATKTATNAPDPSVCLPHLSPCLFNLRDDPCETRNLASQIPVTVEQLMAMIQEYQPVPPNNRPEDTRSYPEYWNKTWTTWQDFV